VPPRSDLAITRRAPFSDNPAVGARGQRSQQRILEAALQVFGDEGYHGTGIIRITELAGCSRASFYQYFSSKEDVFRHLATHVAQELVASAEAMDPVTADGAGWRTLHDWVTRHGQIYARYEPVFRAFQAAVESDEAVASGSTRIQERTVAAVRSRLDGTTLPARQIGPVVAVLQECMTRTRHVSGVLRVPVTHVDAALADVVHRTLFGVDAGVNVRPDRRRARRAIVTPSPSQPINGDLTKAGERTLAGLLEAGHDVLVTRGYHGTRVDDVAAAAGVSHGAFYRYFENKDHLVRVLALRAVQTVVDAFNDIPDTAGAPLRRWLRRYNDAYAAEAAVIRVWVDATAHDERLRAESAAAVEWGRRRFVRLLRGRGFGDVETDALVAVALVDGFGARRRDPAVVEATAHVIERGLLGVR
jgi:AcrR family transcriptional regulator